MAQFYNPDSMYDNINLENVGQNHNENYRDRNNKNAKFSPKTGHQMIFGTHTGVGSHFNQHSGSVVSSHSNHN